MENLNIKDLSDYVLLQIFNFLDKGALKRASRVCERWRDLIVNSKTLTERLTLCFSTDSRVCSVNEYKTMFNTFLETKAVEFPYRNLHAYIREPRRLEIWENFIDIFFKFVKDPLKVEFQSVCVPVVNRYVETYASTLTHLKLGYNPNEHCTRDLPFEFPNLVSLILWQTDIPTNMKAPKLKEFMYYNETPSSWEFSEFLVKFVNLKKLVTCCIPELPHNEIKYQLEELEISNRKFDMDTFKSFIICQKNSLKKLFVSDDKYTLEYREIVNTIIQHTRIEEAKILCQCNTNNLPQIIDDVNYSLKKLKLSVWPKRSIYERLFPIVSVPHVDYIFGTLNKFRGLEHLKLIRMERIDLIFDQVDISNLKILKLDFEKENDFKRFNLGQFKLENMEELKICEVKDSIDVDNLVKIASFCPNLRKLKLIKLPYDHYKRECIKFSHFETIFQYSPNIADLVIKECAYLLSSFMFSIKTVKSNLQRLKVGVRREDRIPRMLAKLAGAKFLCDIHYYKIVGMKPTKWYEKEIDYRKKLIDD